jgi:hypothetical protein
MRDVSTKWVSVFMLIAWIFYNMLLGGDYGTALCAACANGKVEVVRVLLRAEAKLNVDGKQMNITEQ